MTAPGMPSRILMTADTIGGVWTYALTLAAALRTRGIRTVLATMGRQLTEAEAGAAARVPDLIVAESAFRLEWMPGFEADEPAAAAWLLELEARYRPDLIHLNGFAQAALPWRAPTLVVGHSCVGTWWRAVHGGPPPADWDTYAARVAAGLAAADLVVAPTAAFLAELEALYGPLPAGRTIWNGLDPRRFRSGPKEPRIASIGRLWDRAKNLAALDAVAGELAWPVVVAGDDTGPDGSAAVAHAVTLTGRLGESGIADLLARASIFALPARYEPFGLAVLEAALSGCALVLGDIPTLRELWDGDAVFVPPDDAESLRRTLTMMAGDVEAIRRWGQRAQARARRYSAARMADDYVTAYRELIADPAPWPSRGTGPRPTGLDRPAAG